MSLQLTNTLDELMARRKAEALKRETERKPDEVLNAVMEDFIFVRPGGRPLDSNDLRRQVFYRALDAAGLRRVRFHDLRHTYASLLIQQGESLAYIKDQLGHYSIQMTVDTYGHLIPGSNRQAVDRLDDVEGVGPETREESGSRMVAERVPARANYA